MPIFEVEAGGRQFEIDAPDMATAMNALRQFTAPAGATPAAPSTPAEPAEPETWGEYATGLGREALQSALFNFGDELGLIDLEASREFQERHPIASTVAAVAGGVAPFVAGPGAALARAAVAAPRLLGATGNVARSTGLGAGIGAVSGAGAAEGDMGDRLSGAAGGAATGAVAGAAAPAVAAGAGRVLNRVLPGRGQVQGPPRPPTGGEEAVLAAERIEAATRTPQQPGVQVPVPRAMATDSHALQTLGGATRALPYGSPLEAATNETAEQLGRATDELAARLGGGAPQDAFSAGSTARETLTDWMRRGVQQESTVNYDALRQLINPNTLVPLSRTRIAAQALDSLDVASASQDGQRVIALVREAVNRPQGLTWDGLRELRTRVSERLDGAIAPEQGVSARALRSIRNALTEDLRFGVRRAGIARRGSSGARALAAFEQANAEHARLMGMRDRLVSIVGTEGDAPAERVFDRLARMAGVGGNADLTRLALARDVIQRTRPGAWEEVTSAIVARMGRGRGDEFSPGRFVTAYDRMSPQGRDLLFGANTAHRRALDDIATVAQRYEDTISRYANPSGTGRAVGSIGAIAGAMTAPWFAIQTAAGGYGLAWLLARPVTADAVRRYMQASVQAATQPGAGTTLLLQQATRNLMQAAQQAGGEAQTGGAATL